MSAAAALIISGIISAIGTGVGAGVKNSALDKAKVEERGLYEDELERQEQRNRFSENITKKWLGLQEDRFELQKTTTGFEMMKSKMNDVANLLNTNVALRDSILSKWGK